MKRSFLALMALVLPLSAQAQLCHEEPSNPAPRVSPPPLGVMASHTHKSGDWMASYTYGRMEGTQKRGRGGDMTSQMHMLGLMYAPSDAVTVMTMLPYKRISMKGTMPNGMPMKSDSEGMGDMTVSALFPLWKGNGESLHFGAGISLPTGSIDETHTSMMGTMRLPYSMQMGTGTYDLLPSLTYNGKQGDWSYGSQLSAVIHLGKNDNGYAQGDKIELSGWGGYRFNDLVSATVRLDGYRWGDFDGQDRALLMMLGPIYGAESQGGTRLDGLVGVNFFPPQTHHTRFAVEFGAPLYEHLDGSYMSNDWKLYAGWKFGF